MEEPSSSKSEGAQPMSAAKVLLGHTSGEEGEGSAEQEKKDEENLDLSEELRVEEKTASASEKEKTPTPAKAKTTAKKTSSSTHKKSKASSSVATTPSAGEAAEESGDEEEVQSSEHEEFDEEKEILEETEETGKPTNEEEEEEEPPAKRARTPARGRAEIREIKAPEDMARRNIVAPKRIDFSALAELGLEESVRGMFANIGWEKFLDLDTTVYTELVREFYKDLEVKQSRDGEYWSIEFVLLGMREVLIANQINSELGVTELTRMIGDDFKNVTMQFPALSKAKANEMWEELARKEEFTSDIARAASLKTPTLIVCHSILAINFFGKKDNGNTVSSNELFILWAMTQK